MRTRVEAELLGPLKLQQLDRQFGKAQWPLSKEDVCPIKNWEIRDGRPIVHPEPLLVPAEGGRLVDLKQMLDLEGVKTGSVRYMFVMTQVGALMIGEASIIPGVLRPKGDPARLGHPTLTGGGPARICGELHYDRDGDELYIVNSSGRYNRYFSDRGLQQLENVAKRFQAAGLPVAVRFMDKGAWSAAMAAAPAAAAAQSMGVVEGRTFPPKSAN
jgi:hypothetical protein